MADSGTRSVVERVEVERHGGDVGVGQARHLLEDGVGRLVVQHPVPDALVLAVGEQHATPRSRRRPARGPRTRPPPRVRRRSGQSTTSSGTRCSPVRAHSSASSWARDLVEGEVHGAQLVGRERAGVLDGAGGGHVEAVDEHEHDVAAQDRRGGGGGHVVLEQRGLAARTAG